MGFLDKIQDSISSATEQTKLKSQENQLRKERKQKLETLGEQVFNLFNSGQLGHEELVPICQQIAELDGRISALDEQVQAARAQTAPPVAGPPPAGAPAGPPPGAGAPQAGATCPKCGAQVAPGAKFCPSCGGEMGEQGQPPPGGAAPSAGGAPPPPPPPPGT